MEDISKINFGGFPPIILVTNNIKKKREFKKNADVQIDNSIKKNLNILNISNILKNNKT
jgi:hypothetical protein